MKKYVVAACAMLATGGTLVGTSAPAQAASSTTPVIKSYSATPKEFYPTVRDGFRDSVSFVGWSNTVYAGDDSGDGVRQTYNITIRNANSRKVAEHDGRHPDWDFVWTWSGRDQRTGEPVPVGRYTAKLTVTNTQTGETDKATHTLYAKSDTVNRRITMSRTGTDTSARSHTSSCYIDRDWGTSHLNLDCWGGRFAAVRYGFALPANARNVTWSVSGERGCCDNGRVIKTGTRTSARHFDVRVTVTNWAAYTVNHASVTYTKTVRR